MRRLVLFALSLALAVTSSVVSAQTTVEEVSAGAAAVSVVALRCAPERFNEVKARAFEGLRSSLRNFSTHERDRAIDSAERKLRALTISSESSGCPGTANLQLMARTWGFGPLLVAR